ncbi:MAG: hypothetical protein E6G61_10135 [Actinobacteria bacterium]|nr:MAG: hypothetical protein E6G61_10135 [Actinomycetota bacterium]
MSRVDEEIRRDLDRLTRPVRTEGVLEHVARRRARRRIVWRMRVAVLATAVVIGSLVGVVGLNRVFAHREVVTPGGTPTVTNPDASHTARPATGTDFEAFPWICDETQLHADTDGDGNLDEIAVWSPATSCDAPDVGQRYVLHVSGNKIPVGTGSPSPVLYGIDQPLPECDQPFACMLFAAPDIDGDGRAELAVAFNRKGPTWLLALYRVEVDPAHDRYALVRMSVAAPGDLWKSLFDLVPGPATFAWGSSAGESHTMSCDEQRGERLLVVTTSLPSEQMPGAYDVHQTLLRPSKDELVVVKTNDQTMSEVQPPMPNDLCGAPIQGTG